MLRANTMPRSHDAALQKREGVLYGVRVNVAHDVDLAAVIDYFVFFGRVNASALHGERIGNEIIGHNHVHIFADILADVLRQCPGLHITGMEQAKLAVALAYADDGFLVVFSKFDAAPARLPADVRFVHFYFAIEHGFVSLSHRSADSVTEIPCSLVADPKRALDLICADSFASFYQQEYRHEPRSERKMRVIEDRSGEYRELIATLAASELLARFHIPYVTILAARARHAFGPAEASKNLAAGFIVAIELSQLRERHHESTSQGKEAQDRQAA